jgi:hypothetical protein
MPFLAMLYALDNALTFYQPFLAALVRSSFISFSSLVFLTVNFGALGYVIYGVQFLPVPNTFCSRSFFSCFSLLAFCTLSIYLSNPAVPPTACLPTLLALLICGLKVSSSLAASFAYFYFKASCCFASFCSRNLADLSAIEEPILPHSMLAWFSAFSLYWEGFLWLNIEPASMLIDVEARFFL